MLTVFSVLALLAYGLAVWGAPQQRWVPALWLGWVLHALALVVDIGGVGHADPGARFGFAPALSLTLWLVLAVVMAEGRLLPLAPLRRPLGAIAMAAVLLAWSLPGQAHLASSPWAPVHWVLGLASYGLVGAALVHAWLTQRVEASLRGGGEPVVGLPLLRLERLTFQFVGAGVVVLGAAVLLGAWFAPRWQWDHKTVFSVLSWLVLAGLLLGRRLLGWRGRQAARWVYLGSALLLLSYVGSRFVLQVLLHRMA